MGVYAETYPCVCEPQILRNLFFLQSHKVGLDRKDCYFRKCQYVKNTEKKVFREFVKIGPHHLNHPAHVGLIFLDIYRVRF